MKHAKKTARDCEQVTAERITVTLVPKAAAALAALQARTGLSKTDLTCRGIILYEFIDAQLAAGCTLLIRDPDDGDQQVRLL